jgi:hypothetical protein
MSVAAASATVRIYDDPGGQIGGYLAKYEAIRDAGEPVVIDGACASACTLLLGVVPRNQICVTSRAVFAFHSAWNTTPDGIKVSARNWPQCIHAAADSLRVPPDNPAIEFVMTVRGQAFDVTRQNAFTQP